MTMILSELTLHSDVNCERCYVLQPDVL